MPTRYLITLLLLAAIALGGLPEACSDGHEQCAEMCVCPIACVCGCSVYVTAVADAGILLPAFDPGAHCADQICLYAYTAPGELFNPPRSIS